MLNNTTSLCRSYYNHDTEYTNVERQYSTVYEPMVITVQA